MDTYKTNRFRSIRGRAAVTLLIIILPIYGLGIWIYINSVNNRREDISNTMLNQLHFYVENLEGDIERIRDLQYLTMFDISLHRLAYIPHEMNNFERTQAMWLMQQRLQSIALSSHYIHTANIYISSIERTISSPVQHPETELPLALLGNLSHTDQLLYYQGRIYMASYFSMSYPYLFYRHRNGHEACFIFWVEFDPEALVRDLRQLDLYRNGSAVMSGVSFFLSSDDDYARSHHIIELLGQSVATHEVQSLVVDGQRYLAAYVVSAHLQLNFVTYVPEREIMEPSQIYFVWFLIFTGIVIGMVLFFAYFINQEYMQRIKTQQAQLIRLQSQINTHFLYNSYFILHRMILLEDNENAIKFSQSLGAYLKYITRSDSDLTSLSKEVEHARVYGEIQITRFSSRVSLAFEKLPAGYAEIVVPRLIIQPIIENAFKHGLENKAQNGLLSVSFCCFKDSLFIVVEDNGNDLEEDMLERMKASLVEGIKEAAWGLGIAETTGLVNIHRRLRFYFGGDSGLVFSRSKWGGLKVVIQIKLKTK